MSRFLVLLLLLTGLAWAMAARAQEAAPVYFGVRLTPGLVDWFNETARPEDTAVVTAQNVALLAQITAGRRQILFASAAQAAELLPDIADQVDIIGYDPEHWAATPDEEQADPETAVRQMRALADEYDLLLGVGPDRRFALDYGVAMAPYVDQFALQAQRLQSSPSQFRGFADPLIQALRAANPEINIVLQVRTEGSPQEIFALLNSLEGSIDGLGILYTPASMEKMQEMVVLLQEGAIVGKEMAVPLPTPTKVEEGGVVVETAVFATIPAPAATALPTVLPTALPTALPPSSPTSTVCLSPFGIVLGGGMIASLYRKRRQERRQPR